MPILRSMNSESVDLIYFDPPFNTGKKWESTTQTKGKKATMSFKDTWTPADIHIDDRYVLGELYPRALPLIESLQNINGGSWWAYLIYMGVRLAEMRRVLKPTGSIYYHCDPPMSHGVKLLMDAIFGKTSFRNEIIWGYRTGGIPSVKGSYASKHDVILFYAKKNNNFNKLTQKSYTPTVPEPHTASGIKLNVQKDELGKYRNVNMRDWWVNTGLISDDVKELYRNNQERTKYPTQKPLALLKRIIQASSNEGDVVLDPFCGCATTCIAAEKLNRQWIGIDLSVEAKNFVVERLQKEVEAPLAISATVKHLTSLPKRTDLPEMIDEVALKTSLHACQKGQCVGCEKETPLDKMQLDYIVPKVRGGQDVCENFQLLCHGCYSKKDSRSVEMLRKNIVARRIKEQEENYRREWKTCE
ncbi:MAG: DNA methyltransferase [Gammaproteobacteria bacterium WSBS_2016_MAG_OTU1]